MVEVWNEGISADDDDDDGEKEEDASIKIREEKEYSDINTSVAPSEHEKSNDDESGEEIEEEREFDIVDDLIDAGAGALKLVARKFLSEHLDKWQSNVSS